MQGLDLGGEDELVHAIKLVATEYYRRTGKPLGATGEIAELTAASLLGLELCEARQAGFDAWDYSSGKPERVQIKGRAVDRAKPYSGRCSSIRHPQSYDTAILVLLDRETMEPLEIFTALAGEVEAFLDIPGSKSRNERRSMGIAQFRSIGRKVWPN
ncbi:MAG: hypothetical protein H6918_03115 [Sphingomonadaceae bacterium]|nr:hypothetical protein [Sphingomonadaceae bacterium]